MCCQATQTLRFQSPLLMTMESSDTIFARSCFCCSVQEFKCLIDVLQKADRLNSENSVIFWRNGWRARTRKSISKPPSGHSTRTEVEKYRHKNCATYDTCSIHLQISSLKTGKILLVHSLYHTLEIILYVLM